MYIVFNVVSRTISEEQVNILLKRYENEEVKSSVLDLFCNYLANFISHSLNELYEDNKKILDKIESTKDLSEWRSAIGISKDISISSIYKQIADSIECWNNKRCYTIGIKENLPIKDNKGVDTSVTIYRIAKLIEYGFYRVKATNFYSKIINNIARNINNYFTEFENLEVIKELGLLEKEDSEKFR